MWRDRDLSKARARRNSRCGLPRARGKYRRSFCRKCHDERGAVRFAHSLVSVRKIGVKVDRVAGPQRVLFAGDYEVQLAGKHVQKLDPIV